MLHFLFFNLELRTIQIYYKVIKDIYDKFKNIGFSSCYSIFAPYRMQFTVYFDEMITDKRYNFCIKNHLCGR